MVYSSGASTFSSGGSGIITQMIAQGAMDAYLSKEPTVTFFRFRYARHTHFAFESVGQNFNAQPSFGGTSHITLNRAGDLVYYIYVVLDLPGIRACRPSARIVGEESVDDRYCDYSGPTNEFPSYERRTDGAPVSAADNADSRYFQEQGKLGLPADQQGDDEDIGVHSRAEIMGKSAWRMRNAGGCYNPEIDDRSDVTSLPGDNTSVWCHWHNAIGQHLIQRAGLMVGGHNADTLYSDFLFMWEELSGKAGKRLKEMIGKRKTTKQLIRDARKNQRLYVPLPFWFTQTSGNTLPLCTLQFHGIQMHTQFQALKNCIVKSHPDVTVLKCEDGSPLSNTDLQAWVDTTYIYLDIDERNKFATHNFDQLITQVQQLQTSSTGVDVNVPIRFNHPIIELIWAVRRKINETSNNYFNFSGIDGLDPVEDVTLRLNNMVRLAGKEGRYYRLVQPYQHHSSVPKSFVYCYSFALYPEEPQPSGSCNMSRIDNVDLTLRLQEGLGNEQVSILVFGRNWNIMRYTDGLGGTLFNN